MHAWERGQFPTESYSEHPKGGAHLGVLSIDGRII
jgi:hypothetical protein